MAISLESRIFGRRTSPFHVQLQLDKSAVIPPSPRRHFIRGQVVRVFRSNGDLGLGDNVAFEIWMCNPGGEPTGPAFIYRDALLRALYLEVHLDGEPPHCGLVGYELAVVDAPTEEPKLTAEQLEQVASQWLSRAEEPTVRKRWWERLRGERRHS